jgi:hypothetical protein
MLNFIQIYIAKINHLLKKRDTLLLMTTPTFVWGKAGFTLKYKIRENTCSVALHS